MVINKLFHSLAKYACLCIMHIALTSTWCNGWCLGIHGQKHSGDPNKSATEESAWALCFCSCPSPGFSVGSPQTNLLNVLFYQFRGMHTVIVSVKQNHGVKIFSASKHVQINIFMLWRFQMYRTEIEVCTWEALNSCKDVSAGEFTKVD